MVNVASIISRRVEPPPIEDLIKTPIVYRINHEAPIHHAKFWHNRINGACRRLMASYRQVAR